MDRGGVRVTGRVRHLTLMLDSCYADVPLAGASVRGVGAELFDEETVRQLELAVVEGINNAIEHAYGENPGATVCVDVRVDDEALIVTIRDRGASMDPELLDRGTTALDFDVEDVSTFPVGGMGLALMNMAMDEVRYTSQNGENRLTLIRRRTAQGAAANSTGGER